MTTREDASRGGRRKEKDPLDMVQKTRLDNLIKKRAKQYFDEWIVDFQEGIMTKDLQIAQERKELFAVVNRLGRHIDNLEGRITALESRSGTNTANNEGEPAFIDARTMYDVNSLMKRVSLLEEVCGYDIKAESADALFLGSGAFIHPSRNIASRLDRLETQCREKTTSHKSTSLDKMPLFITVSKPSRPNTCHGLVSDDPRYEDFPVIRLAEKYSEQGPEIDLESLPRDKPPTSPRRSIKSPSRPVTAPRESTRRYYTTPHPPGYRNIPTVTRPVSAASPRRTTMRRNFNKLKNRFQLMKQHSHTLPDEEKVKLDNLNALLKQQEEKINNLESSFNQGQGDAEQRTQLDEKIAELKEIMEKLAASHSSILENKKQESEEEMSRVAHRIHDLEKIICLDEHEKRTMEEKIRRMEQALQEAESSHRADAFLVQQLETDRKRLQELETQVKASEVKLAEEREMRHHLERTRETLIEALALEKEALQAQLENAEAVVQEEKDARNRSEIEKFAMKEALEQEKYRLLQKLEDAEKQLAAAAKAGEGKEIMKEDNARLLNERDELRKQLDIAETKWNALKGIVSRMQDYEKYCDEQRLEYGEEDDGYSNFTPNDAERARANSGQTERTINTRRNSEKDKIQSEQIELLMEVKVLLKDLNEIQEEMIEQKNIIATSSQQKNNAKKEIKSWLENFERSHHRAPTTADKESIAPLYVAHKESALRKEEAERNLEELQALYKDKRAEITEKEARTAELMQTLQEF